MEGDDAVLELVERGVVVFVYSDEFLLESLKFVFIVRGLTDKLCKLLFELVQVSRASVDILLSLKQENLLFFVMSLDLLLQRIFSVLEHLDKNLELLFQLRNRTLFFRLVQPQ